jgi:hypothetical protein
VCPLETVSVAGAGATNEVPIELIAAIACAMAFAVNEAAEVWGAPRALLQGFRF